MGGSDDVRVRIATRIDLAGLVRSIIELFAEDAGTRDPTLSQAWPREHAEGSFLDGLGDPARLILVACDGDEVVGHLSGSLAEPTPIRPIRVATLASMYVFAAYRGRGVGADLVARFRQWARDAGADRVAVTAYASIERAIKFYERQGFRPRTLSLEDTV